MVANDGRRGLFPSFRSTAIGVLEKMGRIILDPIYIQFRQGPFPF